jgi:hypothetical protein
MRRSLVVVVLASCAASTDPRLAAEVLRAPGATYEGTGDPANATNGVRGGGAAMGSLDVYSLDYETRTELVLGWNGRSVIDGPGADFVVFENAFRVGTGSSSFMDPLVVSVSRDGITFVELPHAYLADPTRYSSRAEDWAGFAGVTPVLLHEETSPVDPFDPALAGGDAFDLASLPPGAEEDAIRAEGFRYLRLVPAAVLGYPRDPASNGPDVDGVYARALR